MAAAARSAPSWCGTQRGRRGQASPSRPQRAASPPRTAPPLGLLIFLFSSSFADHASHPLPVSSRAATSSSAVTPPPPPPRRHGEAQRRPDMEEPPLLQRRQGARARPPNFWLICCAVLASSPARSPFFLYRKWKGSSCEASDLVAIYSLHGEIFWDILISRTNGKHSDVATWYISAFFTQPTYAPVIASMACTSLLISMDG